MRRFYCLLFAFFVSLCSLTAFSRLHVNAAEKVSYTLSYEETAALFGYESFQVISSNNANKILVPSYNSDTETFGTRYAPNMWYANYTLDGVPYIGIRYYLNYDAIIASRDLYMGINCQLQTSITLDNLYDFSVGAGFLTNYSSPTGTDERLQVSFWNNAEYETLSNSFVSPYQLMSFVNVETGRSSKGTALELSPVAATLPVYDMYSSQGYLSNFLVKFDQPSCNVLTEPYDDDGFYTAYSYIFIRCPTITTDKDTLIQIDEKLDTITSTMEGVQTELEETNSLLDDIKEGIGGVVDKITSLPGEIWNTFSTGLTELFLPSEEALTDYKSDLEALLSDHFGAVWQTGDLIAEYFENFDAADPKETILFPEVTVDVGAPFTFGGWEVQVVPDGFDFLVESLKWIIDVICTLAVVNTLKEKLSDILVGGEQDVT